MFQINDQDIHRVLDIYKEIYFTLPLEFIYVHEKQKIIYAPCSSANAKTNLK